MYLRNIIRKNKEPVIKSFLKLISIDTVVINLGRIVDRALTPFQEKLENLDLFILAYPKLFTYLETGFANNHNVKIDHLLVMINKKIIK
jgi:hypothetical protein